MHLSWLTRYFTPGQPHRDGPGSTPAEVPDLAADLLDESAQPDQETRLITSDGETDPPGGSGAGLLAALAPDDIDSELLLAFSEEPPVESLAARLAATVESVETAELLNELRVLVSSL